MILTACNGQILSLTYNLFSIGSRAFTREAQSDRLSFLILDKYPIGFTDMPQFGQIGSDGKIYVYGHDLIGTQRVYTSNLGSSKLDSFPKSYGHSAYGTSGHVGNRLVIAGGNGDG